MMFQMNMSGNKFSFFVQGEKPQNIAEIMRKNYPKTKLLSEMLVWANIESQMADMFAADNPNFRRGQFYLACEPPND